MSTSNAIPKEMWLKASDREIDPHLKQLIRDEWDTPPTALQIAKALKIGCYFSLTSGFTMTVFSIMYQKALDKEGKASSEIDPLVEEWFSSTYSPTASLQVKECSNGPSCG